MKKMANSYKYRIRNTEKSSADLGMCEICGKYANSMYHQVESKKYSGGYTHHECNNSFGHEKCLLSQRR